jgi:hypothetical protein
MSDTRTFLCGTPGCREPVAGIFCDSHKGSVTLKQTGGPYPGETVSFLWRGVERTGTVEDSGRVNLKVVIELKGKRRIVKVKREELKG